jgi:GNAT superfamily N-acetyltransferase
METIIVRVAEDAVPQLVTSVAGLFAEDGGQRDRQIDTGWPNREGSSYYTSLLQDDRSLCLLAYPASDRSATSASHLIGRMIRPNPIRPHAVVAVLESMRVNPRYRRQGIGSLLVEHFSRWAQLQGANEASVTAYAGNTPAVAFYRHHGFTPFEVTLHLPL